MLFHVAICDDMPVDILMLENKIKNSHIGKDLELKFNRFAKGEDLLNAVRQGKKYELIILDISLSGLSGEEIGIRLRESGYDSLLVFCTAGNGPSINSFKSEPYRFLLKSFTGEEMISELDAILKEMIQRNKKDYILGKQGAALCKVRVSDVLFIETTRTGCRAVVTHESNSAEKNEVTLSDRIDRIENDYMEFVRIHKSFLVNLSRIKKIDKTEVILEDGTVLLSSRPYQKQIREKYKNETLITSKNNNNLRF